MGVNKAAYEKLMGEMQNSGATLIAVSKTKPSEDIMELYDLGHRDFGENYVQELVKKQAELPQDIRWHFIGHLQSNKIKMIAPYVHLIHGVDSIKLLEAIDKEGRKLNKEINCLLQVHVAKEETKFGLDLVEARQAATMYFLEKKYPNVGLCGIMGMASFSEDEALLKQEFGALKTLYDEIKTLYAADAAAFNTLSMGMSGDYPIALASGSNMIRVGSLLFGARG
ncbi:MAG: YggS family pyridoxal phosphate-dependent enzyme [Chitinophagaceae bacterium]|jgi:pyridoxal phosphate enzyme (YggS family)|nr:YggS family pyridoxal phosphate-dependent enzyme [Chitinophagaceae bacterium]